MNIFEAYIGCLLLKPSLYMENQVDINEMTTEYRSLFGKIVEKIVQNETFDAISLTSEYGKESWFCGGAKLVGFTSVPSLAMIKDYARNIKSVAKKAELSIMLSSFQEIVTKSEPEDLIPEIETRIFNLIHNDNALSFKHISKVMEENDGKTIEGLNLDVSILNEKWLLNKGGLHVVAASTNVGKTSLVVWLACKLLFAGHKCLFFSAEMSEREMNGKFQVLMGPSIGAMPLYINCTGGICVEDIVLSSRLLQKTKGLDVIFVDYLQLINTKQKLQSREQYVAHVSRNLKSLAMNLNCAVVACAQLNRGMEATKERRPTLSNLRESGSIEQDADSVVFLYRPDYYYSMMQKETPPDQIGKVEFTIAKQRNRATANLKCKWDRDTNVWSEWQEVGYKTIEKSVWATATGREIYG